MRINKLIILLMAVCVNAYSNENSLESFTSEPILIGGGIVFEIARPSKQLPGVAIAYRNYFENKRFSLMSELDYFPEIGEYENQLDLTTKLNITLLHQGEIILHAAAGPTIRMDINDSKNKSTFSVLGAASMSIDYKLNNYYILETTIENKFGFSRKPDTVISFKIYRAL